MSNINTTPQLTLSTANVAPASGQAATPLSSVPPSAIEGFDNWVKNFQKYELILAEMARVSSDIKFKEELTTIEQWFKVLSEPERTASVYTLMQHSSQDQIRFFIAVLQQMVRPEEPAPPKPAFEAPTKPRLSKLGMRPPSLDLPDVPSPATPTPVTAHRHDEVSNDGGPAGEHSESNKEQAVDNSWASMVATPLIPMFQANESKSTDGSKSASSTSAFPGLGMLNPYTLNLLANAGLSKEAQLLAVQLVMSGLVQPTGLNLSETAPSQPKPKKAAQQSTNWRTPTSARYPASALRSSGLKSSGLKSSGLKSSGLQSSGLDSASMESPRLEDFDPEMLNDIPTWLRSLRLHKYTPCFDGLSWQEIVVLDEAALETKGVAALGARRRLLRTFQHVRVKMGMEEPSSATPTTSTTNGVAPSPLPAQERPPKSAAPTSKLSINSPIFTPSWESERAPHSAAPAVSIASQIEV